MPEKQTIMKSLENLRAAFALEQVSKVAKNNDLSREAKQKYKGQVKKIPVLMQTNGLGNTLAFMCSKEEYEPLYKQLQEWLRKPENPYKVLSKDDKLLEFVISQPSPVYRHVTKELIAVLTWMKRLADSLIED